MLLLQENVYFSHWKVNKNAYFCISQVNKNVILVIFNISKITYCHGATGCCGLAEWPKPESGDQSPKDGGRRITFVAERRGVWRVSLVSMPESGDRSPKDGGRFLYRARRGSAENWTYRVVVLRQFTSIYIVNYRQFVGCVVYLLEDCGHHNSNW